MNNAPNPIHFRVPGPLEDHQNLIQFLSFTSPSPPHCEMPPAPAPPPAHDLTPAEIAALMGPGNHPEPLSAAELDGLTAHLTESQLEEVVNALGLGDLARQLPPVLLKIMRIAKHVASARPPEYDDAVDRLARNLDLVAIADALDVRPEVGEAATPPPSSPELPQTPVKRAAAKSAPSTPHGTAARRNYTVASPSKVGTSVNWLEAGAHTQGVRGASARVQGSRPRSRKKSHAYVVFYGAKVDVFTVWADVQAATTGHGLAIQCGFPSEDAARAALAYARSKGWTSDSSAPPALTAPTVGAPPTMRIPSIPDPMICGTSLNVIGVRGNLYCAFDTFEAAEAAFVEAVESNVRHNSTTMALDISQPILAEIQLALASCNLYSVGRDELLNIWLPVTNSVTITSLVLPHKPMTRGKARLACDRAPLDGAALRARRYREHHREVVNEKAKIRMRQKREQLKTAPSAVQMEYNVRAEQYRLNYLQRTKQAVAKALAPTLPARKSAGPKATVKKKKRVPPPALAAPLPVPPRPRLQVLPAASPPASPITPRRANRPGKSALFAPRSLGALAGVALPLGYAKWGRIPGAPGMFDVGPCPDWLKIVPPKDARSVPGTAKAVEPHRRAPNSPTPMSLADIDAACDSDDAAESDEGWDGDNERDGPVPMHSLDYVPHPGKQPYIRDGRRIWL
ncbi:hypothetical protein C8R47DRAFT_1216111 [Mycena vitilis]|nr:hypothetical protein C8R47DRAFT_1216111 [Mycena vitilis]